MHVCRPLHCKTIKFDIVLSGCFSNKTVRIELHSNMPSIANTLLIPIIDSLLQISCAKILADFWWLQSSLGLHNRAWELPQYVWQLNDIAESNVSTAVTSCSKQITKWLIPKFYWFIVSRLLDKVNSNLIPSSVQLNWAGQYQLESFSPPTTQLSINQCEQSLFVDCI